MSRILVTGGSGFIGQSLCPVLLNAGHKVRITKRTLPIDHKTHDVECIAVGDIDQHTDWTWALEDVDAVVHLAGRAHVMRETETDSLAAYRHVNVDGTKRLAEQAAAQGIKRFIFISSIKVNGERTTDSPYSETDTPAPEDVYGQTKWEAEQSLTAIAEQTGLELVIIRPPLVYGPGVKGNLLTLLKVCHNGIPLPLASIKNSRSFIFVENLADAVSKCLTHEKAAGETFLIRDGEDLATPALVRQIADSLKVQARLLPVPPALLRALGAVIGRSGTASKLLDSLQVDDRKIRSLLGWTPPHSMVEGLDRTATWFSSSRSETKGTL